MAFVIGDPTQLGRGGGAADLGLRIGEQGVRQDVARQRSGLGLVGQVRKLQEQTRQALIKGRFDTNEKIRLAEVNQRLAFAMKTYENDLADDDRVAEFRLKANLQEIRQVGMANRAADEARRQAAAAKLKARAVKAEADRRFPLERRRVEAVEDVGDVGRAREKRLVRKDIRDIAERKVDVGLRREELGISERRVSVAESELLLGDIGGKFDVRGKAAEKATATKTRAKFVLDASLGGVLFATEEVDEKTGEREPGADPVTFATAIRNAAKAGLTRDEIAQEVHKWWLKLRTEQEEQIVRELVPDVNRWIDRARKLGRK